MGVCPRADDGLCGQRLLPRQSHLGAARSPAFGGPFQAVLRPNGMSLNWGGELTESYSLRE